ncbi:MAG: DNA-directed RNA polymerase subunit D [Candidatus Bathyarchaeota archaeon]
MKIQILDRKDNYLRFILSDSYPAFVNALRRIVLSEVPSMTIDDIFFYENTSAMNDEVMAHRIGLIPLKTDLDTYVLPEECECKSEMGCNRCRALATLEVEAEGSTRVVYSGDLKFEDSDIAPTSEKIPITKIVPGQRLRFEAHAKLGMGKQHAKWQPVSACAYKYVPIIEINKKTCDACEECVKACPKRVLGIKQGKLSVQRLLDCTLCLECVKKCPKKPPAIEVEGDVNSFIFNVESTGCLPAERILSEATKIFTGKIEKLMKEVKKMG